MPVLIRRRSLAMSMCVATLLGAASVTVFAQAPAVDAQELSRLAPTDRAFAENVIAAHHDAVRAFQLYASSGADPELRGFADRRLPRLRKLLAAAEDARNSSQSE